MRPGTDNDPDSLSIKSTILQLGQDFRQDLSSGARAGDILHHYRCVANPFGQFLQGLFEKGSNHNSFAARSFST